MPFECLYLSILQAAEAFEHYRHDGTLQGMDSSPQRGPKAYTFEKGQGFLQREPHHRQPRFQILAYEPEEIKKLPLSGVDKDMYSMALQRLWECLEGLPKGSWEFLRTQQLICELSCALYNRVVVINPESDQYAPRPYHHPSARSTMPMPADRAPERQAHGAQAGSVCFAA